MHYRALEVPRLCAIQNLTLRYIVALVDARGHYVLNGNFIVSAFHKELHVSGSILEYSGAGTIIERINGTGMIYEDIYLHVSMLRRFFIMPVADLPSRASLRTALSGDLYVPRTGRRFGDRAFAVVAPRVWNSLPTDIKLHRSTTTSFKRRLKTVLFNRSFAE